MNAVVVMPSIATIVRRARRDDLAALVRLEQLAWPDGMQADAAKLADRIATGGMFVACRAEGIVGALTTFRPRWADARALAQIVHDCPRELLELPAHERWRAACTRWRLPIDWHEATADGTLDRLHRDDSDVVFGVGIATDPHARGTRVAQTLLAHALAKSGARWFVGYGRLPQYHASTLDLDAYLRRTRANAPHDFGLRLHWSVGARPACTRDGATRWLAIPRSMHDDAESRNAGVLVVNPLR